MSQRPLRIGSASAEYEHIVVTSAGSVQHLITGVAAKNLVIYKIAFNTTAATVMTLASSGGTTFFKASFGANGGNRETWGQIEGDGSRPKGIAMPVGEGLDITCTIDPATGWIEIEYGFVSMAMFGLTY